MDNPQVIIANLPLPTTVTNFPPTPSTGSSSCTQSNVPASLTDNQVLPANPNRKKLVIVNNTQGLVYVSFNGAASPVNFCYQMQPLATLPEMMAQEEVHVICINNVGSIQVTEFI